MSASFEELELAEARTFQWQDVTPKARNARQGLAEHCYYLTSTLVGSKVVLLGRYGRDASSALLILDYTRKEWKWEPIVGPYVTEHVAVLKEDYLLVYGGRDDNAYMDNDVWKLDLALKDWSRLPVVGEHPLERAYCTGDILESTGDMVIFGGLITALDPREYTNELWMLDCTTYKWSQPKVKGRLPNACYGHASCAAGGKIFYYGGRDGRQFFNDLSILCQPQLGIKVFTWTIIATAGLAARTGHSLSYVPGKLLLFGGFTQARYVGSLEVFDIKAQKWWSEDTETDLEYNVLNPPEQSSAHSSIATSHKLLVFGGRFSNFETYKELSGVSRHRMPIEGEESQTKQIPRVPTYA